MRTAGRGGRLVDVVDGSPGGGSEVDGPSIQVWLWQRRGGGDSGKIRKNREMGKFGGKFLGNSKQNEMDVESGGEM